MHGFLISVLYTITRWLGLCEDWMQPLKVRSDGRLEPGAPRGLIWDWLIARPRRGRWVDRRSEHYESSAGPPAEDLRAIDPIDPIE